ncbi:Protein NPGR2 [Vitis vinifera]|uniref:Protein NPGR2 n=1 Tax=Vitis vinifera TaxID=29760 RepID=A0A438D034_VITVI|nr:Protein NPGR2 [Vitis vinifera]
MTSKNWMNKRGFSIRGRLRKMMKCICSGEQLRVDEIIPSSESLATRDYSASGYSSRAGDNERKPDTSNIEEAESSLRESVAVMGVTEIIEIPVWGSSYHSSCDFTKIDMVPVNFVEARALLGRLEYQKGNIEAALHVFEGIDIAAVTPKMKLSIARRCELHRRRSQSEAIPPMSMHAVSLLIEAIFLKAKSLQALGRFGEAAQSCKVILDTVESALPEGLPENFAADCKLLETLNKAVELLPELWKLAGSPQEAILSYRQALLHNWNLDMETATKIEKEFAIFLLYSGSDASPPNLRSQMEGSFVPRNNIEEAILLLMILLRKFVLKRIAWDPSIIDHLSFALSVSGELRTLAHQVELLLPGIMERKERFSTLALCYHGEDEGTDYAHKALSKILRQYEALEALETAERTMIDRDPNVVFHLSLENAEQRKLDAALHYARQLLKIEAGSSVKGWILLARILSAQKQFEDAECVINAAMDQTGKWDQGELLRTKAKLQIAQGRLKNAIETYTHLLAVLQVRNKNFRVGKQLLKNRANHHRRLEMETWHDLANVYTSLSQWRDAEVCLSKSKAIGSHSASRWHSTGLLYEAKGLHKEALKSFGKALDVEPSHVPSLISTATVLRKLSDQSLPAVRSFLTDALRIDRTNPSAWYNLGLVCKAEMGASAVEATECFEAAAFLQETAPVEPFR